MKHTSCVVAFLCVLLAASAMAEPPSSTSVFGGLARCTPTFDVPAGAAAYCYAVAQTPPDERIYILLARIMGQTKKPVPQWGYGFSAAPGVRSIGYYAEEAVGSTSVRSRYCQVVIDPADAQLNISFTVHYEGEVIEQASTLGPCPENNGQGQ